MKQRLLFAASMVLCCVTNPLHAQWYEVTDKQTNDDGKMLWCNYNYKSVDERGEEITLSAYMQCGSSPDMKSKFIAEPLNQLVLAHHVTIFDPKKAPTSEKSELIDISMAGNQLYIVPDYQGFGSSVDRNQLYLIHDLSARQCYDALEAGKKLFDEEANVKLHDNWGLYLTGASQGASNAVATQRFMEQQELDQQWRLQKTLVADGPYCPTAMLESYMYDPDYQKLLMPLVLPLTLRALWTAYPEDLAAYKFTDCFTQSFLPVLTQLENGGDADEISKQLTTDGPMDISTILSTDLLNQESALQKAIKACLAKNDLDQGWTPIHQITGYGCINDDVIPNLNNTRMAEAFDAETFAVEDYSTYVNIAYPIVHAMDVGLDGKHQITCGLFLGFGTLFFGAVPYLASMIPNQNPSSLEAIETTPSDDCLYDLYGHKLTPSSKGFSVKNGRVVFTK